VKLLVKSIVVLIVLAACGYLGLRAYARLTRPAAAEIPTAAVKRGDLRIDINAKGELTGGNPEVLSAPMIAGGQLHITYLPKPGEAIKAGDVVVRFDTSEQEFNLKEAESDLAEAEQKVVQAEANKEAEEEEGRYLLEKAQSDLEVAEIEARKNPLLPAITAKENDLAVQSAKDHLKQVEENLATRGKTGGASVAIEEAGRSKAQAAAKTARQNIESMTLRAHRSGYVSIKQNMPTNGFFFDGMVLPLFQTGDAVNPGMAVAEIPDLHDWQIEANIGELDRGHIVVGEPVLIGVPVQPGHKFHGAVKEVGGTTGPFWNRHFECRITLSDPSPELRPGMSAELTVTTETMHGVLSVPAESVFSQAGKNVVYRKEGSAFTAHEVKLVRRSDARAVVEGVKEGDLVALSNPLDVNKEKRDSASPMGAVGK
jgi:hypothetical protein